MQINLNNYLSQFTLHFPGQEHHLPWKILKALQSRVLEKIKVLNEDNYYIKNEVAIHKNAMIEEHVILKDSMIISENCFIGAHAYLRGGVYLSEGVSIGPGCEIKSSIILSNSVLAHFNFIGDSVLGSFVNMEAGSIIANHYNERDDKRIFVVIDGKLIETGVMKFGALVGDHTKIGANAVLSPGTLLPPYSVVKRLELIEQVKN